VSGGADAREGAEMTLFPGVIPGPGANTFQAVEIFKAA
jgi:hypothetical protein